MSLTLQQLRERIFKGAYRNDQHYMYGSRGPSAYHDGSGPQEWQNQEDSLKNQFLDDMAEAFVTAGVPRLYARNIGECAWKQSGGGAMQILRCMGVLNNAEDLASQIFKV